MDIAEVSILIVDDVNALRMQFKEVLRNSGFRKLKSVENIQTAKEALEDEPVHLVLCDWHMAVGNGIELLKYVRQHPEYKDLPFIMVTAENTKDFVLQAVQSGVDDYIMKPLTLAHVEKVKKVLAKKQVIAG